MQPPPTRSSVAAMIDHTLLAPEATPDRVLALCDEAIALDVAAVCISPRWVTVAVDRLAGTGLAVATVCGFPSGAHTSAVKATEAREAVAHGAAEVDMVVALGAVMAGDWDRVTDDIAAVRAEVTGGALLKVIIESALLDEAAIDRVCDAAVRAGADYVKTSTGFHPAGGASTAAVARMRAAVGPDVGVKAAGGIRDAETAVAMIEAGATRIGASASAAILASLA